MKSILAMQELPSVEDTEVGGLQLGSWISATNCFRGTRSFFSWNRC